MNLESIEPSTTKVFRNIGLPGQYYDQETGLHYNYFRDYDPTTGRYTESDPIGLVGGFNRYTYVNGNPLIFIDLFGLAERGAILGGLIGGRIGQLGGGAIGALLGGAGGMLALPGGGTIWLGISGAAIGSTTGGILGAGLGAALGSAIEDTYCKNDTDDLCKERQRELLQEFNYILQFEGEANKSNDGLQKAYVREAKINYNIAARIHNRECPGYEVPIFLIRGVPPSLQ